MNPDKDDDEWLKLADAIADMEIDTSVSTTPKLVTSSTGVAYDSTLGPPVYVSGTSASGKKEVEAIWIDEVASMADDMMFKLEKEEEQHQEENSLVKINSLIATEKFSEFFIYDQPGSVTIKSEDGRFSKKRLLGGERFLVKRAYQGKKATIFVFKVEGWKDVTAELTKADASRNLTGFDDWHEKLMREHGDRVLTEAKKPAEEMEKEASERYEAQGDTNFGSW